MKADRQCYYRFDAEALHASAERSTIRVIALTAVMMIAEIVGGIAFGSMALLADGWHMATHVAALGITALAYRYARTHADSPVYTFGTGKFGVLGGFASGALADRFSDPALGAPFAVGLGGVLVVLAAVLMAASVPRLRRL